MGTVNREKRIGHSPSLTVTVKTGKTDLGCLSKVLEKRGYAVTFIRPDERSSDRSLVLERSMISLEGDVSPGEVANLRRWLTENRAAATAYLIVWCDASIRDPEPDLWLEAGADDVLTSDMEEEILEDRLILAERRILTLSHQRESEQALRRRGRQLEILAMAGHQINAILDVPSILGQLVESAVYLVNAREGMAALIRDGETGAVTAIRNGRHLDPDEDELPTFMGSDHVIATHDPYVTGQTVTEGTIDPQEMEQQRVGTLATVPIINSKGHTLGILEVRNGPDGPPFDPNDVELIQLLAHTASVALDNAQMLEDRNRAELALRLSERKYRLLFEEAKAAIYISTRDGTIVDCNRTALDLFGMDRNEALGIDAHRLYAEPGHRKAFQEAIESDGFVRDYPVQLKRKDESIIDCLETATVWRDQDGGVAGYQGILLDVTLQKRAEAALRASEERYRKLVETSPDAVILAELDGTILMTNRQAASLHGFESSEEMVEGTSNILHLVAQKDRQKMRKEIGAMGALVGVPPQAHDMLQWPGTRSGNRLHDCRASLGALLFYK